MNEIFLEIKDVDFEVEKIKILKNINLEVKSGEVIGIIGPNGSGKSTLLKSINGINKVSRGEILLNQKSIYSYDEKELARNISFMSQNTNIAFDFPCEDVVMLGRYPHLKKFEEYGKSESEITGKYMEMTNTFSFRNKLISELSGGERQKVLFAKALTQEGKIILLDEPSANLDMHHEEEIFKIVTAQKREGITTIVVIHNLRTAIKYCTRLILLSVGEIIKDGIPEEVIMEENLKNVYKINAKVYKNDISKRLDFCIL
ncbi:MAG: ABC transporter ATP-binding protein [Cetobacterium sp.]